MITRHRSLFRLASLALGLGAVTGTAFAQLSGQSGTITSMYMASGGNYAVRVKLSSNGVDQLSTCPGNFAYINTSDSNYEAYVAGLLTRYSQGQPVSILINRDQNNYCHIAEFTL